ncbi:DUF2141 domain-containing protein [Caulobacter segnis]|uniref:DUF2141 domain-containing protein n=1 Tax=Caulobacter segnis TaxID=88688 RepID=UPI00240F0E35|nr:DUF2141 domain-containing protein [Caulobacter segnis]MDG2520616.1 DUF2141 domain-containing protein [Caulobacter segnis]
MIACFFALGLTLALAAPARAASLQLSFPNLKGQGEVAWAVHGDGGSWGRRGPALRSGVTPVGRSVVVDLPPGEYGVMAYHDRNGDLKLNTLPIGLPTEPYGFSNNSRGRFGPPAWNAARFTLPPEGTRQVIQLR